jgi:hypothetical protein
VLLAVMIGSGWSCGKLVGADFDKPLTTGGTGGAGGAGDASAQSTATTGSQATSTGTSGASTASSGAGGSTNTSGTASTSSASSASSASSTGAGGAGGGGACVPKSQDDVCGPQGDDADCDQVIGDCNTKPVYVWFHGIDGTCSSQADDVFMSDTLSEDPHNGFVLVSQFKVFKSKLPGTTELSRCATGGGGKDHRATIGNASPCTSGSNDYKLLGYVSTTQPQGYEEVQSMVIGPRNAIVVENATYPDVCCHSSSDFCTDLPGAFVPTKGK